MFHYSVFVYKKEQSESSSYCVVNIRKFLYRPASAAEIVILNLMNSNCSLLKFCADCKSWFLIHLKKYFKHKNFSNWKFEMVIGYVFDYLLKVEQFKSSSLLLNQDVPSSSLFLPVSWDELCRILFLWVVVMACQV